MDRAVIQLTCKLNGCDGAVVARGYCGKHYQRFRKHGSPTAVLMGGNREKKHGMHGTPTYGSWQAMKQRCLNPKSIGFSNYGGRGVKVCESWLTFENFLADMGERPDGTTIDRIDSNGNYEPTNCKWSTPKDQQNNLRNNRHIEFRGRTLAVSQWSAFLGIPDATLRNRLFRYGWSIEKSLTS